MKNLLTEDMPMGQPQPERKPVVLTEDGESTAKPKVLTEEEDKD